MDAPSAVSIHSQPPTRGSAASRVAEVLVRHATTVIVLGVALTAALVWPLLGMKPTRTAPIEPAGPVFEANRIAEERFASRLYRAVFLFEAKGGNLLAKEPLLELWRNAAELRNDPELGPKLAVVPTSAAGQSARGLLSIADAVDATLRQRGAASLAAANDEQVASAVSLVLRSQPPTALGLSTHTRQDASGRWVSPAAVVYLWAERSALGGASDSAVLSDAQLAQERFARSALARLRGEQRHVRAWGIAIDVNLTSAEQGRAAGPFIGLTILAVLLLVGLAYRSYWAVALGGLALGALMVWLKGGSNLLGFEGDQILSTIVPIAMISFGIDFAFHSVGRYREYQQRGASPRRALVLGLTGVLGALILAAASDAAAFLSNTTTRIESLVQFGVAAALAQVAALGILGIVVPLALMRLEQRHGVRPSSRTGTVWTVLGAAAASLAAMAAVVLLVFVSEPWGLGVLGAHALIFIGLPTWLLPRVRRDDRDDAPSSDAALAGWPWVGRWVGALARKRRWVLPAALLAAVGCTVVALRVQPRFDVKDFFAADCDFVVGLDKLDEHLADRGGEPATIYVQSDLSAPATLRILQSFAKRLRQSPSPHLARDDRGQIIVEAGVVDVVNRAVASPAARAAIRSTTGTTLTDEDGDGLVDDPSQAAALFRVARATGWPPGRDDPGLSPAAVERVLWQSADGQQQATRLAVRVPGSRAQESVAAARAELEPMIDQLRHELRRIDARAQVVLTGAPIVRQASLAAILRAFRLSLPVAVALCFVVAAAFMRSWRYAAVSIAPIVLVVPCLYALMHGLGYGMNVVTATIGAVSIGIGIDFAVHFTMRYREELRRAKRRSSALERTGSGTGSALLTSALSSVVGFTILAFAPMPMFAAYGLLTAIMIAMAAAATLLVLPALLTLVGARLPTTPPAN